MNYKERMKKKETSSSLSLYPHQLHFGDHFYLWTNSRDSSSKNMTTITVTTCTWMAIFNRWIDARTYQHALLGQHRVKLSWATVMLHSVSVAMAPGCHWVSGANPGGQTRLSDSPGKEMSSDAKVSQLHSPLPEMEPLCRPGGHEVCLWGMPEKSRADLAFDKTTVTRSLAGSA